MITASKARKIISLLKSHYPDAHCELNYRNPFELLVATILSAQCTDKRVNIVTEELFRRYPDAETLGQADQENLESIIRSTGFFKNKATNLRLCAQTLVDKYGGQVPQKMEDLVKLPGVGRKTANVVLGNAFGIAEGVVVDTHVSRLSQRLGFTEEESPEKIEKDLMRLVEKKDWILFSHWMIFHGRKLCKARNPHCDQCFLEKLCCRK